MNSKIDHETKEGIQDMRDGNVKTEQEMESLFKSWDFEDEEKLREERLKGKNKNFS